LPEKPDLPVSLPCDRPGKFSYRINQQVQDQLLSTTDMGLGRRSVDRQRRYRTRRDELANDFEDGRGQGSGGCDVGGYVAEFTVQILAGDAQLSKVCGLVSLPLAIKISTATPISRLVSNAPVRWLALSCRAAASNAMEA
jgi:hypothetical protein